MKTVMRLALAVALAAGALAVPNAGAKVTDRELSLIHI